MQTTSSKCAVLGKSVYKPLIHVYFFKNHFVKENNAAFPTQKITYTGYNKPVTILVSAILLSKTQSVSKTNVTR